MDTQVSEQPAPASPPPADSGAPETTLAERLERKLFGEPKEPPQPTEQPAQEQAPEQSAEAQPEQPSEQESADDSEEVEFNGAKYIVPKELKSALMANADYTKKTQELAATRSALQAERESMAIQGQLANETAQETQQLSLIDAQLRQLAALDWGNMDTDTMIRTKHNADQLKEMRETIAQSIQAKAAQAQERIKESIGKAREDGVKWLQQAIPNFSEQTAKDLVQYATNDGYLREEVQAIMDPRMIRTLWKAAQWDALQSKGNQLTEKRLPKATPVLKPGTQSNSNPPQQQRTEFRKAIRAAKTDQQKAEQIQQYLARKFER